MIKTVTLTANQKTEVMLTSGCHCCIENRSSGTVYASKKADIAADADGVTAISSGNSKILRNTAQYCVENSTYDYRGKLYLLSDSDGKVEIQTADDLNFFKSSNSNGGGGNKSGNSNSCIVCSPEQPTNLKKGLWIQTDKTDKEINILNHVDNSFSYENFESCTKSSATLVESMTYTSAAAVGNKCYIFGGEKNSSYFNYIQIYDTTTNTLTKSSATLTYGMRGTSATSVENKCYIFGGYRYSSGHNYFNYIQIYDTTTNTLTKSSATLTYGMRGTSAASVGNKCYIFGGYQYSSGSSDYFYSIQIYDTTTNTRTKSSATLEDGMYGTSAASVGNKCYIFGGEGTVSSVLERFNYIQIYDTTTNTRTKSSATLKYKVYETSAASTTFVGNKCYIFDGSGGIQIYDTTTNTLTESSATLTNGMYGTSAASVGNKCYIFGGEKNNSYFNDIQICSLAILSLSDTYKLSDSILLDVFEDCNESSTLVNQVAISTSNNIYNYKPIKAIYYVDSDNHITELQFDKIESYQVI